MKKTALLAILAITPVLANESVEECKQDLLKELHRTGLMTQNVCVDFQSYPNFNVKIHNNKYELGRSDKDFDSNDTFAVNGLMSLMSEMEENEAQLHGYADAVPMGDKFDSDLFSNIETRGSKKYGVPKMSLAQVEKIKDRNTREALKKFLVENKGAPVELDSGNAFVNLLRNHELAARRAKTYCEKFDIDCDDVDLQGAASPLMITKNSRVDKDNKLSSQQLSCAERRGAELKFVFNDDVQEPETTYEGDYIPRYNSAPKRLQDKMHLAGSLSLFKKMKNAGFKHPSGEPDKDKFFLDVKGDQARFKKLFADNPGCAQNPYNIDASRRLYWSVVNEKNKADSMAGQASEAWRNSYKKLSDAMDSGDYSAIVKDPELKKLFEEANDPKNFTSQSIQHKYLAPGSSAVIDKYNGYLHGNEQMSELYNSENSELSKGDKKLKAQMILLLRTASTGRPVFSELSGDYRDLRLYEAGFVTGTKYTGKDTIAKSQNKLDLRINSTGKLVRRYPNAPSPMKRERIGVGTTLTPPPTSVFNCLEVYDALAEHIQENSTDESMLVDNLKIGQTIKMDVDHIKETQFKQLYSDPQGMLRTESKTGKGWICQACGSGVHVHDDGSVHLVSRDRDEEWQSRKQAESSVQASRGETLSMGSMLNLTSYIIPNCEGCGCVKNKTGDELKKVLEGKGTKKHYLTSADQNGALKLNEKAATVRDLKTCVFVPPVPHSCTFRPTGESEKENNLREIKGRLYCKMRDALQKLPTKEYAGKPALYSEAVEICEETKGVFPRPEADCYPQLKFGFQEISSEPNSGGGAGAKRN